MTILGPTGPTWDDVLDDLEFQVDAAERLISRGETAPYSDYSWSAPRLAEPLRTAGIAGNMAIRP